MLRSNRVTWLAGLTVFVAFGTLLYATGVLDSSSYLHGRLNGHGNVIVDSSLGSPNSTSAPEITPHCVTPVEEWNSSRFLKGPPTKLFRENLLENRSYITCWAIAGFTNQFMGYANMIYLGFLSDRIPIIPPFGPGPHISRSAGLVPFGRIFNLTRARIELHKPLLEWSDVKDLPSPTSIQSPPDSEREPLGCFSTRPDFDPHPNRVREIVDHLQLDIAYSRVPTQVRLHPSNNREDFLVFPNLAPYIFPRRPRPPPNGHFQFMEASPLGQKLPPDNHMACFDYLYYITSSSDAFEWERSWAPAWVQVGKYLDFTDDLVEIVEGYLRRVFGSSDSILPFIAVHIRRGDFGRNCDKGSDKCFIPLATFKKKVDVMISDLLESKNIHIEKVIIMSDEKNLNFWEEVKEIGWVHFNHKEEDTLEKYGEWYLPIIDIVAQSMATGFVGTASSTFSLVSARRVEDWNGGPIVLVSRSGN
ncbi:hypothetical protein M413DRAFT_446996 [Hebeloma cylindrosporum]|uniref:Uncharacterized protein n=1 Tax=Hebeloma cylindrosporum TaxID=76867 RepID=A0A0C3BS16_HEBCY|nr:hypothetical protein M413DRAFT_446996 [Hebeloma cylindrosporum h7]